MRRTDPYQERARELCRAAGIDPDSRIERPSQRSMPAWCAYRDAARQEQLAREAAAAAQDIVAMRPQEARFQNSPLNVFGQHEDATIAQMRNCMAVGNVVAGVLCADGHMGYAQPVGGVIRLGISPRAGIAVNWGSPIVGTTTRKRKEKGANFVRIERKKAARPTFRACNFS